MTDKTPSEFAQARDLVRTADRDRYVATLFAPPNRRDALIALHAFDVELARIPHLARQQIAGEIRLQWWREAVDGSNEHEAQANPIAAALMATIADRGLPTEPLHAMIDARGAELTPEAFANAGELLAWCDGVWGAQLACACRILDAGEARGATNILDDAGRAIGITQLLMTFAMRAARGQSIVPAATLAAHGASAADVTARRPHDGVAAALAELRAAAKGHLDAAQAELHTLPRRLRPALVLLSLVAPRLDWLARQNPYAAGDVTRWRRLWRMWRA
jgi:phytoene synthase